VLAGIPVGETGVMPGNQIFKNAREKLTMLRTQLLNKHCARVQRTCGRMRLVAATDAALDASIGVVAQVVLKARAGLAQVMPNTCQARPQGAAPRACELTRQLPHLREVLVKGVPLPGVVGAVCPKT
jgi:hypothetical protein